MAKVRYLGMGRQAQARREGWPGEMESPRVRVFHKPKEKEIRYDHSQAA